MNSFASFRFKRILSIASLVVLSYSPGTAASDADRILHERQVLASLIHSDFLDDGWSRPFVKRQIHFLSMQAVDEALNGKLNEIREQATEFVHPSPGSTGPTRSMGPIGSKEIVKIGEILITRNADIEEENFSIFVTFVLGRDSEGVGENNPIGMSVFNLKNNPQGKRESILEYVMTDLENPRHRAALKGMSRSITDFNTRIYQLLGVITERLWAAWAGRVVWAKTHQLDPEMKKYVDGIEVEQEHQLRDTFNRLCQSLGVELDQLRKTNPRTGSSRVVRLDQLKQPADYLGVFAIDEQGMRRQFLERAYISFGKLTEPQWLDLWQVYMMGDLRFDAKQDRVIVSWEPGQETKQSSTRMGTWFGIRQVPPGPFQNR